MKKLLLLLLPLLITASGCFTPTVLNPFLPEQPADRHKVVLFGDSLSWDSSAIVMQQLRSDPNIALSHNSFGGTTVQTWLDQMKKVPAGTTVVMALGTNDVALLKNNLDLWKIMEALNILHDQGVDCIVWMTLSSDTADRFGGQRGQDTYEYNYALRTLEGYNEQYPQLHLQEWDLTAEGHDDWYNFPSDWLHHSATGNEAYAASQVDAINRCGSN